MNVLVVHAHPEPASFCSALKDAAVAELEAAGHAVTVSDLYAMDFEPRVGRADFTGAADPGYFKPQREQLHASGTDGFAPDVAREIDRLLAADLLLLSFPLWWFSVPAILKGWFDRVLVMGALYGGGKVHDTGVLRGRRALCVVTTGGPSAAYGPEGRNGELDALLAPVHWGTLHFVGCDVLAPFVAWGPARADEEGRAATLAVWRERVRALEHEAPVRLEPPRRGA